MYLLKYAQHARNKFNHTLSNAKMIWARGNDLMHTESTRKCLKFEYLCEIEIFFQKSLVAGPWDDRDLVSEKNQK
jgi:hypothetical protein